MNTLQVQVALLAIMAVLSFTQCKLFDPVDDPPAVTVGDTLWIHDMAGADSLFTEPSVATGTNGDLYYAAAGGTLYWTKVRIRALNAADGVLRWESPVLDAISLGSPIVVGADGTVYVIGQYRLYAIDPQSGQFLWIWQVPTELPNPDGPGNLYTYGAIGALAMAGNGNLILGSTGAGVYSRAVYCVGPSGNLIWYNPSANGAGVTSGIVIGETGLAYFYSEISGKVTLVALDVLTGTIQWTKPVYSVGGVDNNLALDEDGTLIASFRITQDDPFAMYRLDPANGDIFWKGQNESNANIKLINGAGAILQDDNLIGGVAAYRPGQTSATLFSPGLHANLHGTVITGTDQIILVNPMDFVSTVHAYTSTGQLVWTTTMADTRNSILALTDGQKVVGLRPDGVFALQTDQSLSARGWPTVYHDNRNTSNLGLH